MKSIIMLLSLSSVFTLVAADVQKPFYNHVPATLGADVRRILPAAKDRNHVLVVNVDGAIPKEIFPTLVTYTLSRINVNAWTNSIDRSVVAEVLAKPAVLRQRFGEHAKVVVFLENNETGPGILTSPGLWSMMNMRAVGMDHPDQQTLKDRYAKMLLKGVAYACGAGASVDNLCALNYESFSLKGMDKTDIRLSPMTYFPMISVLRALAGDEATSPLYE